MAKPEQKQDEASPEMDADPASIPPELAEELDEEEAEFHAIRKDLPGVKVPALPGLSRSRWARRRRRTNSSAHIRHFGRLCRLSITKWEWKNSFSP